jgi:hypothetical protein
MTDTPANPFRPGGEAPVADDSALFPFADRAVGTGDLSSVLTLRVEEMNLGAAKQLATPRAAALTVKDLNDLAAEFSGVPTNNPDLPALSIEDLNSLEAVFTEVKIQTAKTVREAATSGVRQADVSVSCCCCTPCCCCAAAEIMPFGT